MGSGKKKKVEVKQVNSENRLFQGVCCKTRNVVFLLALVRTDDIRKRKGRYRGTGVLVANVRSSSLIDFIFSVWTREHSQREEVSEI